MCSVRTCGAFALSQCVQTITASHSRTSRENPIRGDVSLGGKKKKKKERRKNTAARYVLPRFRLKSSLSSIPDIGFFLFQTASIVLRACNILDGEFPSLSKVTPRELIANSLDVLITRFNNYLHRSPFIDQITGRLGAFNRRVMGFRPFATISAIES